MTDLEQLIFSGTLTLLTYVQHSYFEREQSNQQIIADALAAVLCEMLNRLEVSFPDITEGYGWTRNRVPLNGVSSKHPFNELSGTVTK